MIAAIRKNLEQREEGFTLIELLVVVIIIGILAAIAIPTFLNQRERGWQAELTSAVRNAALEIEANATANGGTYPAQGVGQGLVAPFQNGTLMTLVYTAPTAGPPATAFSICGTHSRITAAHNVTFLGAVGTTQGGLQGFASAAC